MDDGPHNTPAPTGLAPLQEEITVTETPALWFEFEGTQTEPPLEKLFLSKGGTLAGAAARGTTDFALSGSEESVYTKLSDNVATVIKIPLPGHLATMNANKPYTLDIDNRAKLLVCSSREGAAINGSVVGSISGQGAAYLSNVFRGATGHVSVPLCYAAWQAHTATVAASGIRIVDKDGRKYNVNFVANKERDTVLEHGEAYVGKWAEGAWHMRTSTDGLRYEPSPTLTKAVFKCPVGVNDSGYDLVHNALEMRSPYSYTTINSMLENALQVDLEFDPQEISKFIGETKIPGKKAAVWGRSLAASLSMLAGLLVNYRADGRTRITPESSEAVAAESWLRQTPRSPIEANDCDGSAILVQMIARIVGQATTEVAAQYEYINAFKNVLVPHYQVGVSVLGASGAEASGGGDASHPVLAGHAATIMIPSMNFLRALEKGGAGVVGTAPVLEASKRIEVADARYEALFPSDVIAAFPEADRAELGSWSKAKGAYTHLQAYGIEGTTPASPILHATGDAYKNALSNSKRDEEAFSKAAPNVGRSIKILYTGGRDSSNPHKFYHDFVEFNLPRSNPLWTSTRVRETGCAGTQFVLGKEPNRVSAVISGAGATPREVVTESYSAVPLVVANSETAQILDFASAHADLDVMPPRPTCMQLNQHQSETLAKSLKALSGLDDAMKGGEDHDDGHHTVAYILAYSTLVNNPTAVEHLCTQLKAVAVSGMVDSLDVLGMARSADGEEAGKFVVINALIPVSH